MNFAELHARASDLRHAFQTQVGPKAMGETGVRGPAGTADEAAFLRLTAWSFAILFEQGRITIPFLLQESLPNASAFEVKRHRETRAIIQSLRTWLFHSLTADNEHDLTISKAVSAWFLTTCGSTSPQKPSDWESCFRAQCAEVSELMTYCTTIISGIAAAREDAKMIFDDLRRRLLREWEPHQYDALIEDAATRMGETINARPLRDRHISEWRKYLASLTDDADCQREMERVIDGEVANHFRATLPLTARELMEGLQLEPGPAVKRAIELLRQLHDSGVRDKQKLLSGVAAGLAE
jgi:hypothetical protein